MSISVTPRGGAFTGRGGWSPQTTYYQDDFTVWQGVEYQSLLPVNKGNQPDTSGWAWIAVGATTTVTSGRLYRSNTAFTSVPGWQKIPLDTASYDISSNVTQPGNGRCVAPVSGVFIVCGEAAFTVPVGATDIIAGIYLNGAQVRVGSRSGYSGNPGSTSAAVNVSDAISMNAGNYIELWAYTVSAYALDTSGADRNYLSVTQVH